jgi:hypothetical protein
MDPFRANFQGRWPANSTSISTQGVQSTSSDATHNPLSNESEITREEAIRNLLMDEDLSDLLLVGTDGVAVRSNRCMLASRSKVFRGMLYGDFSEASSSSVSLGYKGKILQTVVEYIYTDKCEILNECNIELARTVVSLADAANYFDLPKLSQKAKVLACSKIREQPSLACVLLDEYSGVGGVTSEIEEYARQTIRSHPSILLDQSTAISSLSPALLETIIQDKKIDANEHTLFRILECWANADDDEMSNSMSGEPLDAAESQHIERREAAKQMTHHIRLERIDPNHLSTTVTSSGLATRDQLFEAYKLQALDLRKHGISLFDARRLERLVWKKSNNTIAYPPLDFLSCSPLTSGIHEWTIEIGKQSQSFGSAVLGVVFADTTRTEGLLGLPGPQSVGWFYYGNEGCCLHDGKWRYSLPKFERGGSEVTFMLDLREETGGTLSASVDENPSFVLFRGMLSQLREREALGEGLGGLTPVAGFHRGVKLRIVGMQEL